MKHFVKIVNDFQPLNFFAKRSILDVWQGYEYSSEIDCNHVLRLKLAL